MGLDEMVLGEMVLGDMGIIHLIEVHYMQSVGHGPISERFSYKSRGLFTSLT
jgi:hypothetical protein